MSLFDGMSCTQLALAKLNLVVEDYYASEIDPYAIKTTQKNFPNTVQLGDICEITTEQLEKIGTIDLVVFGSPCQGFSIAGKKLDFEDPRSQLFFEAIRILEILKPRYFLMENVRMPGTKASVISANLGVEHRYINSSDFGAMNRKRYYWTNLPFIEYEPKVQVLEDVLDVTNTPFLRPCSNLLDRTIYAPKTSADGIITINSRTNKQTQTWQRGRIYDTKGKLPTICASLYDLNITQDHKFYRKLAIEECELLQGVPTNYTEGVPMLERGRMLGNGFTVPVVAQLLKPLTEVYEVKD